MFSTRLKNGKSNFNYVMDLFAKAWVVLKDQNILLIILSIQKLCPINNLSLINLLMVWYTIWITPFPKTTFRTSIFKSIIVCDYPINTKSLPISIPAYPMQIPAPSRITKTSKNSIGSLDYLHVNLMIGWRSLRYPINSRRLSSPCSQTLKMSSIYLHHSHDLSSKREVLFKIS